MPIFVEMTFRCIRYGFHADFAKEMLGKCFNCSSLQYLIDIVRIIDDDHIATFISNYLSDYRDRKDALLYYVQANPLYWLTTEKI